MLFGRRMHVPASILDNVFMHVIGSQRSTTAGEVLLSGPNTQHSVFWETVVGRLPSEQGPTPVTSTAADCPSLASETLVSLLSLLLSGKPLPHTNSTDLLHCTSGQAIYSFVFSCSDTSNTPSEECLDR
ncbi:hypothetical protein AOLI_G00045910 [Acnodon oligacanthus]